MERERMKTTVGASWSKVIISGEHSVVYGHPALVASVDRKVKVTLSEAKKKQDLDPLIKKGLSVFQSRYQCSAAELQVTIESNIPPQSGMGSSAAVTHALFRALGKCFGLSLSDEELIKLVHETETFAHGKPSGVDTVAVVKGGILSFQREQGQFDYSQVHSSSLSNTTFMLIQSGKPVETTREMVELVAERKQSQADVASMLTQIGGITRQISAQLSTSMVDPQLLTENQRLLDSIGVVGAKAAKIVKDIEQLGGAAKITGAGGIKNGSGMILAYHDDMQTLANYATRLNLMTYQVQLGRK